MRVKGNQTSRQAIRNNSFIIAISNLKIKITTMAKSVYQNEAKYSQREGGAKRIADRLLCLVNHFASCFYKFAYKRTVFVK